LRVASALSCWMRLLLLVSSFTVAVLAQTASVPVPSAPVTSPAMDAHCAQIAASDPKFGPLAQACQYALSPGNLPNFECDEEELQLTRYPDETNWIRLAVITAEVTFVQGEEDQYANVAIDGFRIRKLAEPHSGWEVTKYLQQNNLGGMKDLNHFGRYLLTVFTPQDHASFEYRGEINMEGIALVVFAFQVRKQDNNSKLYINLGGASFLPGFEGLIWINKSTSSIRRIVVHDSEIDSKFPIMCLLTLPTMGLSAFLIWVNFCYR
jgi:hypothetical protein